MTRLILFLIHMCEMLHLVTVDPALTIELLGYENVLGEFVDQQRRMQTALSIYNSRSVKLCRLVGPSLLMSKPIGQTIRLANWKKGSSHRL